MKITVQKKTTSFAFDAGGDENLLYAGLRQRLALPYECATGTCGSCRARLTCGELDFGWPEAPGREHIKPDRDEFLMCQARARSDCEIRVPGNLQPYSEDATCPDHYTGTLRVGERLTHDVLQFDVELERPVSFQAGQFVTLEVAEVPGYRAYSMVNYAPRTQRLQFVVKRFAGGRFSDWLFDAGASEAAISVFGPLGNAVFQPHENQDVLCIAGGSGIAGMMSILAHGCDKGYFADRRGQLYFGVRTAADVFFLSQLTALAEQFPQTLELTIALSEQSATPAKRDTQKLPPNLHFTSGMVHVAALQTDLAATDSIAYVAGPPPMVDATLRALMLQTGFEASRIRYDKFS